MVSVSQRQTSALGRVYTEYAHREAEALYHAYDCPGKVQAPRIRSYASFGFAVQAA